MRPAEDLTTRLVTHSDKDEVPTSEILLAGVPTGKNVSGAVLEGAIRWNDFYLLFMTDDTPQEEMLGINLFDEDFTLLDSAILGGPYTSGSFSSLELREPNTVSFRFIGDTTWTVEIFAQRHFRVPFIGDAPGVRRPLGMSRHFVVRGNPRPQTS